MYSCVSLMRAAVAAAVSAALAAVAEAVSAALAAGAQRSALRLTRFSMCAAHLMTVGFSRTFCTPALARATALQRNGMLLCYTKHGTHSAMDMRGLGAASAIVALPSQLLSRVMRPESHLTA